MSYDLYLFQPEPGVDLYVTAERLFLEDEDVDLPDEGLDESIMQDLRHDQPISQLGQREQQLGQLLLQYNPTLEVFPHEYDSALRGRVATNSAILRGYDYIELSNTSNGIQIGIFPEEVSVSVPYWHTGEAAQQVFREIWDYLKLLEQEFGYRAYDPQVDKVLDLAEDLPRVVAIYQPIIARMHKEIRLE